MKGLIMFYRIALPTLCAVTFGYFAYLSNERRKKAEAERQMKLELERLIKFADNYDENLDPLTALFSELSTWSEDIKTRNGKLSPGLNS
jgi:hypothetical protein